MPISCRSLILIAAIVLFILLATPFPSFGTSIDLQVKIDSGTVEGKEMGAVRAFLGISYAAPPVGDLRWKPPAPPAKWSGIRAATDFGAHCMQGNVFGDMTFHDGGNSEDCLTLNVWTPAKAADAKLPVMVWIHGGGFVAGATSESRQHGETLAGHGVVVVSMNYRLGMFGFFVHPELAKESGRNSAGNYGLLDQVAALEWVHRNIASFGGDPVNVTIFGESAGSFSVSVLMASPLAKGLFQKAIGESGGAFFSSGLDFAPRAAREEKIRSWWTRSWEKRRWPNCAQCPRKSCSIYPSNPMGQTISRLIQTLTDISCRNPCLRFLRRESRTMFPFWWDGITMRAVLR
jgi:para-nitrobenzyl esterase